MEEANEGQRVVPELYFLIAKFLSGGPLKETAKTLLKELENVEVLPRRLDWEGNEHAQSFNELDSQYADLPWWRLAAVCAEFLRVARGASPLALPAAAERSLSLSARLSLLSDALVRPRPKYSVYKEDHTLVRRLQNRELGTGGAAAAGGRGGESLFSSRMLAGLRLQRRTLGHLSAVYCVVFDSSGRYVLTGADDLLVKVWSAVDGRLLATLRGAGAEITDACVSRDGALLAAGSVERLVRVWSLRTGAPTAVLSAHGGTITSVHWAPPAFSDVRWLASTSTDGSVAFWTCSRDGQFLSQPVQYVERMRPGACHMICAAWSAGGGFLAAGSADQHVRVYAIQGRTAPRRVLEVAVHTDAVDSIAWAHRGLRFVSGSKDGCAALWTLHAAQWRHVLLRCLPLADDEDKRVKVTMVCWDRSDACILTAVSDSSLRVWCTRTCTQIRVLKGHRDEAYVLEAHPTLAGVILSAGHDGQLLVWDAPRGRQLASFHNHIAGQGDGAIFDAKWGGMASIAATDSHGHLLLLGLGRGHELLAELPAELFFHTDYRPLVRDALGGALDEQTETPPHLMAPPFLVDVEGAPHPPRFQRLVPGRGHLALEQLIPAPEQPSRLDQMIEALAADRSPTGAGEGARGPWRGEGVRHTAGSWHNGEPSACSSAPIVPPLADSRLRALEQACAELYQLEQSWYRRELRRRPVMISTATDGGGRRRGAGGRRPAPRALPRPRPRPPPPRTIQVEASPLRSGSSDGSLGSSDESVVLSGSSHSPSSVAPRRPAQPRASSEDDSSCSYTSGKTEESSESSYSDWEAGEEMAPPARARRKPLPAKRYSPSAIQTKRLERATASGATTSAEPSADPTPGPSSGPPPGPISGPVELPEAYRPGEWLCAVSPRKAPYHPQMGDNCLYFRLGHQRYFEAVAEKDVYKVNPRDKPWERTLVHECELVKVVGIKYVIKPPRIVCLRLACQLEAGRPRTFTVKYHDMADVIDFLVLRQQYDAATQRRWGHGDRFRCMIDDSWWTGVVVERTVPNTTDAGASNTSRAALWSQQAAAHFLSLKVRWDNGEVERLSPWDLEPLDPERLPSEPGGSIPVLPHELDAVLYKADPDEWPPRGDRAAACRAIAKHIGQVMSLSVAEPFVAPVDLQQYPSYAMVVPYPIDLATIRARFEHLFYRRAVSAAFDVRYLATNAEQFNEPHSPIVRQARLVTDLLLHIISNWREVDVVSKYHELCAAYHSSDDEPLARHASKLSSRSRRRQKPTTDWRSTCSDILRELMMSADAEPFKEPVSLEQAPDYLTVVAKPMALATIARKLAAGEYSRAARFAADVRRVFSNSRLYNTNKRSRIYSMTVRLSALFESLWTRAALEATHEAHDTHDAHDTNETHNVRRPRRAAARSRRVMRRVLTEEDVVNGDRVEAPEASSSESETLAAASRRAHRGRPPAPSSDSDAPLHTHRKGKGVGKKSKRGTASEEPTPGTSRDSPRRVQETYPPQHNGDGDGDGTSSSEDEALARIRGLPAPSPAPLERREQRQAERSAERGDSSGTDYCAIQVLEEELHSDVEVDYGRRPPRSGRKRRRRPSGSSDSDKTTRARRQRAKHTRTRERFTEGSSSSSASSRSSARSHQSCRRYESDRSYRPRSSSSSEAPLLVYRQRAEQASAGPSTSSRRPEPHRKRGGGVSLRARRSPRRYNEDSEEDSIACISKRLPHHHQRLRTREDLSHRRRNHAMQLLSAQSAAPTAGPPLGPAHATDHNYFNGAAGGARHANNDAHGHMNGEAEPAPPVSISSRGRVRKLTAKARGLLRE